MKGYKQKLCGFLKLNKNKCSYVEHMNLIYIYIYYKKAQM